jgi:hypothetical protein
LHDLKVFKIQESSLCCLAHDDANPDDHPVFGAVFPENLDEERYNEEEDVNQEVDQEESLCGLKLIVNDVSDDWRLVTVIGELLIDLKHVISQFKLSDHNIIIISNPLNSSDSVDITNTFKVNQIMLNSDILCDSFLEIEFVFHVWQELSVWVWSIYLLLKFTKS